MVYIIRSVTYRESCFFDWAWSY